MDAIQSNLFRNAAGSFVLGLVTEFQNPQISGFTPLQCAALSLIHEFAMKILTKTIPALQKMSDSHFVVKGAINFVVLSGCAIGLGAITLTGIEKMTEVLVLTAIAKTVVLLAQKLLSQSQSVSTTRTTPPGSSAVKAKIKQDLQSDLGKLSEKNTSLLKEIEKTKKSIESNTKLIGAYEKKLGELADLSQQQSVKDSITKLKDKIKGLQSTLEDQQKKVDANTKEMKSIEDSIKKTV